MSQKLSAGQVRFSSWRISPSQRGLSPRCSSRRGAGFFFDPRPPCGSRGGHYGGKLSSPAVDLIGHVGPARRAEAKIGSWTCAPVERKALLEPLVANKPGLQFNGHDTGGGEVILKHAGKLGFEGVVSKTIDAPYAPGNRGLWRKAKALNSQEFIIVGWSDPEGSRPYLGALLLGYYTDDGKLIYAGRVGTGMPVKVLADLRRRLEPLARKSSPLNVPPPRSTRFGSPLVLSRVHWVDP
jgi:hypothetical protein